MFLSGKRQRPEFAVHSPPWLEDARKKLVKKRKMISPAAAPVAIELPRPPARPLQPKRQRKNKGARVPGPDEAFIESARSDPKMSQALLSSFQEFGDVPIRPLSVKELSGMSDWPWLQNVVSTVWTGSRRCE